MMHTKQSDVFSLGKVFCFSLLFYSDESLTLSKMLHYQGELLTLNNKRTLTNIKKHFKHNCAYSLIKQIISDRVEIRPDCDMILNDILFWNNFKVLDFLKVVNETWNHLKDHELFKMKVKLNERWSKGINGSFIRNEDYWSLHGFVKYLVKKVCKDLKIKEQKT